MSCYTTLGLYLNCWQVLTKFYPACELLCHSWALFELLKSSYEIPSREWVSVHLLYLNCWGAPWYPFQRVSCCAPPMHQLTGWHASIKSYPASELLCTFLALCELLTCSLWNPIQFVSFCVLLGLYLNCWHTSIKSHPASELLCTSWALFDLLTCPMKSHPGSEFLCTS